MKKLISFTMMGLIIIGINAYAAGDLIVNGNVGIGTSTPSTKLDLRTDTDGLNVNINQTSDPSVQAANYEVDIDGPTRVYVTNGFSSAIRYKGTSSPLPATRAAYMQYQFRSLTPGNSTFGFIRGLDLDIRNMEENVRDFTGNELSAFRTGGSYEGTGGLITVTNVIGANIANPSGSRLVATNKYGVYLAQQTGASNNYGLVLDGQGAGADISFGLNGSDPCRPSIYTQNGEIYVKDSQCNATLRSPHDRETGEWIFYSKNTKTGRVVRVDMEKLVKAVEKITGETFMMEKIEEIE